MKRILFSMFLLIAVLASALPAQSVTGNSKEGITRSYELKHITAREAANILESYIWSASYTDTSPLLTVNMPSANLAAFEENLKRIDVEKRAVQFRIFTVIASSSGESGAIENRDLKGVLDELKKLLSFRAYRLDGVSVITANEGAREAELQLSSSLPALKFELRNLRIDDGAQATLRFGFRLREFNNSPLLSTDDTALKEKGYLVAGVSKLGKDGESLVLVINAEIKK